MTPKRVELDVDVVAAMSELVATGTTASRCRCVFDSDTGSWSDRACLTAKRASARLLGGTRPAEVEATLIDGDVGGANQESARKSRLLAVATAGASSQCTASP